MLRGVTALLCFLAIPSHAAQGGLRDLSLGPETATAMAGIEGEACPKAEHERFKTIVCKIQKACKCADSVCELEWCSDYVHEWRKEFGACLLKGCEFEEAKEEKEEKEEPKEKEEE
mmetsp:Transcript_114572/g.228000  ORF Transcript_114572/g.228000 Transcript_114572/m.228000 type:complete len:116 (+) Transcript_114572:1-348(+)